MLRDAPLSVGETYHIYNRGAHKQSIFNNEQDYRRFLLLLHLCNSSGRVNMRDVFLKYKGQSFVEIIKQEETDHMLVDLFAYCLMPNHFHIVLQGKAENGITQFLKKVLTGYSMYFNTKYDHSGVLFQGPFKSRYIDSEPYFRYIFSYVHLNALDLIEPNWKEVGIQDIAKVRKFVNEYRYSSFFDYAKNRRPETRLLSIDLVPEFLTTQNDLEDLLAVYTKDCPLYK